MAKILEGKAPAPWTAKVRCAHPACAYFGGLNRVDGCFAVIEITLDDIVMREDCDGQWHYSMSCPSCGQLLYPEWQIGITPWEMKKKKEQDGWKP